MQQFDLTYFIVFYASPILSRIIIVTLLCSLIFFYLRTRNLGFLFLSLAALPTTYIEFVYIPSLNLLIVPLNFLGYIYLCNYLKKHGNCH